MRKGPDDFPWSGIGGGLAPQPAPNGLDQIRGQVREVAQGLVFDLAPRAVGAAEQMGFVDAALIDAFRRGYMNCPGSSRHSEKIQFAEDRFKQNQDILVATLFILFTSIAPSTEVAYDK